MNRSKSFLLFIVAAVFLSGCPDYDPQKDAYGGSRRVGVSSATYVAVESISENMLGFAHTGNLGFNPANGVEIFYAHPLSKGFDVRASLGTAEWDVNFDTDNGSTPWPEDEKASWHVTSLMFLLNGGWRWGRFGTHFNAGPGVLFNRLEWDRYEIKNYDSFAMQSMLGFTLTIETKFEFELEMGYRWSRAGYEWTDAFGTHGDDQILEAVLAKAGVNLVF